MFLITLKYVFNVLLQIQGKEPMHFLCIFPNPIIITNGGYDKKAGTEIGLSETSLYQVLKVYYVNFWSITIY